MFKCIVFWYTTFLTTWINSDPSCKKVHPRGFVIIIKSPPTMWLWRLIVFAESARRRRHLFLLSLENPYSDYFQIFAVCILALLCFSTSSAKSKMAAKILCRSLELELLHGFVLCLVQWNNPTLDVCWLVFCVILIIKTFLLFRILTDISVLLILAFIKIW